MTSCRERVERFVPRPPPPPPLAGEFMCLRLFFPFFFTFIPPFFDSRMCNLFV